MTSIAASLTACLLAFAILSIAVAQEIVTYNETCILLKQSSTTPLESLNGPSGFDVTGIDASDESGYSIGSGDINGDGFDDILIGAPGALGENGQAYVVFGSAQHVATYSLKNLNGTNGFVINGISSYGLLGTCIDSGDVNGDGIDDVLIGASNAASYAGQSYVIFGSNKTSAFSASFSLSTLNGTNGFVITGPSSGYSGTSISSGDINGDGIHDVLIGAPSAGANTQGASYVVFGSSKAAAFSSGVSLSTLDGTTGFYITGNASGDGSGQAIGSGDVNGDGVDDVLIGAPSALKLAGQSYVVYGSKQTGAFSSGVALSSLTGTNGFAINGIVAGDMSGSAISSGDINNDGLDDVLIGAYSALNQQGQAYIVFGASKHSASFPLSSLNGTTGSAINGSNSYSNGYLGSTVSSGDVNGDGIADVLIGARGALINAGQSYAVFGSALRAAFASTMSVNSLDGVNGLSYNGYTNDESGYSISAGDINGDGVDDVLIGAVATSNEAGKSYIVLSQYNCTNITTYSTTASSSISTTTTSSTSSSSTSTSTSTSSIIGTTTSSNDTSDDLTTTGGSVSTGSTTSASNDTSDESTTTGGSVSTGSTTSASNGTSNATTTSAYSSSTTTSTSATTSNSTSSGSTTATTSTTSTNTSLLTSTSSTATTAYANATSSTAEPSITSITSSTSSTSASTSASASTTSTVDISFDGMPPFWVPYISAGSSLKSAGTALLGALVLVTLQL